MPNYYDALNTILEASSFINAWATNIVFVNVDSYVETGHNYYIYHNPLNDKFEWITWDVNEAFGLWNIGMPLKQLYDLNILYLPSNSKIERPLSHFMLQEPVFRRVYTDKVYDLVRTEFKPEVLFPEIERLYHLIKDDVYLDTNKTISNQDFETNIIDDVYLPGYPGWIPGLQSFIQQRHDILMAQLSDLGYTFTGIADPSTSQKKNTFYLYPNPANDYIILVIKSILIENTSIEITNANGQLLLRKKMIKSVEQIDLSRYSKGIYFLKLTFENTIKTERIIKL